MQLNKSLEVTKANIANIIRMVTLAHASECTMQQFNDYYENKQSDNLIKNIYNRVLIKKDDEFNKTQANHLSWVINHAICNFVEEIHLLYINLLHLMKINSLKFSSDATVDSLLNELEDEYYDIKKSNSSFSATHTKVCDALKFDDSFKVIFKSIIYIRNSITHDGSTASRDKNQDININYFTLSLHEAPIPNTDEKAVGFKKNKKSKQFKFGGLINFSYSEFNEISFTIVEFIKALAKSLENKL